MKKENKTYELSLTENYVVDWGIQEALRELAQNAIDENSKGYEMEFDYDEDSEALIIKNNKATLNPNTLLLGNGNKQGDDNSIGKYGEGYKLALIVLLRENKGVHIYNNTQKWVPYFSESSVFEGVNTLHIDILESTQEDLQSVSFVITGITLEEYMEFQELCLYANEELKDSDVLQTHYGEILLNKEFKNQVFVGGLFVATKETFDSLNIGFNFNPKHITMGRDREYIWDYDMYEYGGRSIATIETLPDELYEKLIESPRACGIIYDEINLVYSLSKYAKFLKLFNDKYYHNNGLDKDVIVFGNAEYQYHSQQGVDNIYYDSKNIADLLSLCDNDRRKKYLDLATLYNDVGHKEKCMSRWDNSTLKDIVIRIAKTFDKNLKQEEFWYKFLQDDIPNLLDANEFSSVDYKSIKDKVHDSLRNELKKEGE